MPFSHSVPLSDYGAASRRDEAHQTAMQDRNMELVGRAASHLLTIDPAERAASFEQIAQTLKGGYDLDISQYREQATGAQSNVFLESAVAATTKRAAPKEQWSPFTTPEGVSAQKSGAGKVESIPQPKTTKTGTPTTDMKNWAEAAKNPEFKKFLESQKKGTSLPAVLQEWAAFKNMTPAEKVQFINMKRAGKTIDTGPSIITPNPADPGGPPIAVNPKGLAPERKVGKKAIVTVPGVEGGDTVIAPGGAVSVEQVPKTPEAERAAVEGALSKADAMLTSLSGINKILDDPDRVLPVTGTVSTAYGWISGTGAGRVRSYVKNLQSGVALKAMIRLKNASATGSTGFGQMNAKELQLLIDDLGRLETDSTDEVIFRQTINRIEASYIRVIADIQANVTPENIRKYGFDKIVAKYSKAVNKNEKKNKIYQNRYGLEGKSE